MVFNEGNVPVDPKETERRKADYAKMAEGNKEAAVDLEAEAQAFAQMAADNADRKIAYEAENSAKLAVAKEAAAAAFESSADIDDAEARREQFLKTKETVQAQNAGRIDSVARSGNREV